VTCDPCPPPHPVDNPLAKYLGVLSLPKIKTDTGIAEFARGSTITRLHLRYTKDTPPDDLVFKVATPLVGGTPEAKEAGPGKVNRFQGRYVMWIDGCAPMGGGLGLGGPGGGFFTSGSPLNRPQSTEKKLVDPIEELIVADLPALDLKARPLRKDAPKLEVKTATPSYVPTYIPTPIPSSPFTDQTPVVDGPLGKDLVHRVLKAYRGQIRYCYESSLMRKPGLAGKVMLQFVVNAEGTVATSMISNSSLGDADVEACLAGRARTWSFPKAKGVSKVSYPLVFKPQ
jgi:TonB family protein